jgi:hypothetical protein
MARPGPGYGTAKRAATAAGEATDAAVVRSPAAQALTSRAAAASGVACGAAGFQVVVGGAVGGGVAGAGVVVTGRGAVDDVDSLVATEPDGWDAPQALRVRATSVIQARRARLWCRLVPLIVAAPTVPEVHDRETTNELRVTQ